MQQAETLYTDHRRWLHAWLRGKLGSSFDADDLLQDTFVRVLRKSLPPDLCEPRAYLRTIAHDLLVNRWRRQDVERACLETLAVIGDGLAPSPEEHALLVDTLVEIDALLAQLNPKARTAFLLAQLDGLTYGQIAERLQVSERMVKKYMAQAMLHCLQADLALPAP